MKRVSKQFDDVTMMYVLAGIVLFAAIALGLWFIAPSFYATGPTGLLDPDPEEDEAQQEEGCAYRHVVHGRCVATIEAQSPRLFAVMVENHPDARPQSGLAKADLVYEAPVEGNFSRFMLIFDEDADIAKIGPVRSARPYYLDWAAEYGDPMYAHVGGSPAALERITNEGVNDLNEFYRGWFFWRSDDRYAPHNVYTSTKLLGKAMDDYADAYQDTTVEPWVFAEQEACTEECIEELVVTFSGRTFEATWKYNTTTQQYERYQDGAPHRDLDGTPITADTIIVQRVETQVLDAVGRLAMNAVGFGEATIFQKGHVLEGEWAKEGVEERTHWIDKNGALQVLQPGTIWVEVLNQQSKLTYN